MRTSRPPHLQALALGAIALTAVSCSAAAPAPPVTPSAVVAAATSSIAGSEAPGGNVAAACDAMVTVNAIQPPGTDPEGPPPTAKELTDWVAQVEGPLTVAANNTPPELSGSFGVLTAALQGAKTGTPIDTEDPAINEALATINGSIHDHCGFQPLDVANDRGVLSGIPASMTAGPVAIEFTNSADPATAAFVLLVARIKDGETATLADVVGGTVDLGQVADVVAAASPTGDGPAYATATLTPGHYVVAAPLGTPPDFTGFIAEEFDVR